MTHSSLAKKTVTGQGGGFLILVFLLRNHLPSRGIKDHPIGTFGSIKESKNPSQIVLPKIFEKMASVTAATSKCSTKPESMSQDPVCTDASSPWLFLISHPLKTPIENMARGQKPWNPW